MSLISFLGDFSLVSGRTLRLRTTDIIKEFIFFSFEGSPKTPEKAMPAALSRSLTWVECGCR